MTATRIGKRVLSNAFVDLLSERVLTVLNSLSLSREDIKGRCRSRCTGIAEEDRRRGRSTGREIAPWFFFSYADSHPRTPSSRAIPNRK
jgi:hypothetical protein